MSRAPLIDWNRIILDLGQRGYSVRLIGVEIGVPHPTILGWKNIPGTDPKYHDGKRLVALWCDVMQKTESDLPASLIA